MAGIELPSRAIREQMTSALHLVIHVRRYEDGVRRVESIAEVLGLEGNTPQLQDIFRFEPTSRGGKRISGQFVATGIVPRLAEELRDRDFAVPLSIFQRRK
jgi:pilus assembly protein CpaF